MKARKIFRAESFIVLFFIFFALNALVANAQPPDLAPVNSDRGAQIFEREQCPFCHSARDQTTALFRVTFSLGYLERIAWQWARNGPDLTNLPNRRTDDFLLAQLVNPGAIVAGSPMPSYAHLPDADLKALIAFIQAMNRRAPTIEPAQSIQPPNVPSIRESYLAGRSLYRIYCVGCHGREGNGAGAIGHLLQPEPRNFSDAAWMGKRDNGYLFRVIAQGKSTTAMPGYDGVLTAREQALVLYYVRFFADPSAQQAMEEGFVR